MKNSSIGLRYQFPYHRTTAPKRLFRSPDRAPSRKGGAKYLFIHPQLFHLYRVMTVPPFHAPDGSWVQPNVALHEVVLSWVQPNIALHKVALSWVQPNVALHEVAGSWVQPFPTSHDERAVAISFGNDIGDSIAFFGYAVCLVLMFNQFSKLKRGEKRELSKAKP